MSTSTVPSINTPPTKQSPTSTAKPNRLPAPTLFVGPPSRNASQLSVNRATTDPAQKSTRPNTGGRQKTALSKIFSTDDDTALSKTSPDSAGAGGQKENILNNNNNINSKEAPLFTKPSEKSIDAKWRSMQSTLNEVELTAQSSTHVFGESHARALDELRNAQVALAKAWGRGSEAEKVTTAADAVPEMSLGRFSGAEELAEQRQRVTRARADTELSAGSRSTVLSDESSLGSGEGSETGGGEGKNLLEDETALDIRLAGERRAANEAYFKKVDQGVKEVVERLEKVAEAMRGVEGESRSLWSGSESESLDAGAAGTGAG